jgi:hypothetical protein
MHGISVPELEPELEPELQPLFQPRKTGSTISSSTPIFLLNPAG